MTSSAPLVRAVIADDEPIAREGLRDLLGDIDWITVVGEAASGPEAIALVDRLRPDLLFLDIEMPGRSGLDVARQTAHQPHVVFTTAYTRHAVAAFELGALDYLVKPFGGPRLATALTRVRAALGESATPVADRLAEAMSHGPMTRLFVRSGTRIVPVDVASVSWFEADGDYVTAHCGAQRHVLHLSLNRLEERLDATQFVRIHRTHIVNLSQVKAFRRTGKGLMTAELRDGTQLAVSRARAGSIRELGA